MERLFPEVSVFIRGAGDLASGVAYRLFKSGFPVIMTERAQPLFVRRTVSFGNAIYENGKFEIEGIRSIHALDAAAVDAALKNGIIPVLIDEQKETIRRLNPAVVVDARMQKSRQDTRLEDAPLVIALGPSFTAGLDCHAVIETQRGHNLGRVLWQGQALPNTGTPGQVAGYATERVLRAPSTGFVVPAEGVAIGTLLNQGDQIAVVNSLPVTAPFPGMLRGLIHPSVQVWQGLKIGDLDPRGEAAHCTTISDKALAIGGGVLEAILSAPVIQIMQRQLWVINYAPM